MSALNDDVTPYADMVVTLVQATERVAIGFVPFVGPTLDFCEAVTGRAWCMPDGAELTDEERIFSGAGVAIGSVATFWGGVKNAGIGAKAAIVAEDIAKLDEVMAKGFHANPRTWYKTLRGAITSAEIDSFEILAGRHLQKEEGRALLGIGDDGVRKILGIPKDGTGLAESAAKAPDFLSITSGNKLALSEAKGGKQAGKAVDQLRNAVKALKQNGLVGDLERVEVIVQKGQKFDNSNFVIKNGFLFDITKNKPVAIDGVPGITNLFVRVIEI
jgi:hypothetical protein